MPYGSHLLISLKRLMVRVVVAGMDATATQLFSLSTIFAVSTFCIYSPPSGGLCVVDFVSINPRINQSINQSINQPPTPPFKNLLHPLAPGSNLAALPLPSPYPATKLAPPPPPTPPPLGLQQNGFQQNHAPATEEMLKAPPG